MAAVFVSVDSIASFLLSVVRTGMMTVMIVYVGMGMTSGRFGTRIGIRSMSSRIGMRSSMISIIIVNISSIVVVVVVVVIVIVAGLVVARVTPGHIAMVGSTEKKGAVGWTSAGMTAVCNVVILIVIAIQSSVGLMQFP